jgi:maltose/moltooligosaccharide transporter
MLRTWFHVSDSAGPGNAIPFNVRISFYVGAIAFLCAVLWTIFTSPEYPPEDPAAFRKTREQTRGAGRIQKEIGEAVAAMPLTMRRLAVVQFFTWVGLFCMWLHFSTAVPAIFGAKDPAAPLFKAGAEWAGVCYAVKDAVTFVAAFGLMALARRMDRRHVHGVCLTLGGAGLLALGWIHGEAEKGFLLGALALGGIAWASILSMPYAILAGALPAQRMGIYMGIFNLFIVLPEIIASLTFGPLVKHLLHGNLVYAVMAGGAFMILAALLCVTTVPAQPDILAENASDRDALATAAKA